MLQRREERFVEAVVVVKFGVEGGGDLVVVAHSHRCVVQGDEGLDVRTEGFDARGANEGEGADLRELISEMELRKAA